MDPRAGEHAKIIVDHSARVGEGDNVLIMYSDFGLPLAREIYMMSARKGASPLITTTPSEVLREYYESTPEEFLDTFPEHLYQLVKASDVVVSIRGERTTRYLSGVDPAKISWRSVSTKPISEERLEKRWCLTQFPSPAYAQEAEMSLAEYEDFVYAAMLRDWEQESKKMERLKEILDKGE
jgi:aminopeptidase